MNQIVSRAAVGAARRIVSSFGVADPSEIDVEAWAYEQGAVVTNAPLRGASGRLVRRGGRGIIRVDSSITLEGQKRFCVAHELGHFLLHARREPIAACEPETMLFWYRARPDEPEANEFAAELLMPEDLFRSRCSRGPLTLEGIEALAADFRTTLTATAARYVEIGPHVCALVVSRAGQIHWFRAGGDFRFRLRSNRTPVGSVTCAADFFKRGVTGKQVDDVPATEWLEDGRIEPGWTLRELLVPMPSYGSALSLLWIVPGSALDRFEDDEP